MSDVITLEAPKARNLFFTSQVDQSSISSLTKDIIEITEHDEKLKQLYQLNKLEYNPDPIKIYIDSYGGQVYQCWGLLSIMDCNKTPIHTIVTGCAMSCGFMILIHGHKRFGYKYSTPMYHQVSYGFWGKVKEGEEELMEGKRVQKMLEDMVLNKTKISRSKLKEIYDTKRDWFMTAEQARQYGVIDSIIK